jgi:hypothetical protein
VVVARFVGTERKSFDRALAAGLLVRVDGFDGVCIPEDFQSQQPTRDDVLARREQRAEAGRIGGRRSGESRRKQKGIDNEASCFEAASSVVEAAAKQRRTPGPGPDPVASTEVREETKGKKTPPWIFFSGDRLEVSKDDVEAMAKQMGAAADTFDFQGWFFDLDRELVASGAPWDRAWLWARFRKKSGDMFGDLRPATRREIEEARVYMRKIGTGCPHEPKCPTPEECVDNVVWYLRERRAGRVAA